MTVGYIFLKSQNFMLKIFGVLIITLLRAIKVYEIWDPFFGLIFLLIYVGGVIVLLLYVVSVARNGPKIWQTQHFLLINVEISIWRVFSVSVVTTRGLDLQPIFLVVLGTLIILSLYILQPIFSGTLRFFCGRIYAIILRVIEGLSLQDNGGF